MTRRQSEARVVLSWLADLTTSLQDQEEYRSKEILGLLAQCLPLSYYIMFA